MRKTVVLPLLLLSLASFLACGASGEIIIVNETKPSFYAVSEMRLSGDLDTNRLVVSGSGRVISGENVKVYLLGRASDLLIDNLVVNGAEAPVSFDDRGYFMVLPVGAYAFQGDLSVRTAGQVRLYVPGPVNALRFDLKHGYAIHGDQYGLFGDEVIVQRAEKAAMLVSGGFKYSYAERNEFSYQVGFRSFGSSLGRAVLNLRNGESVLAVTGAKDYSVQPGRLVLELEGDTANVAVTGTFSANSITVPLDEGRHHVLVESDPQKKMSVATSAEEIDLKQSTLTPSYSNARAFLASKDEPLSVALTPLQMYPSLAASVSRATNRIAITDKGSMLAELNYRYSNTGVDYIGIDAPGTPLYAATGYRDSVKLTKDGGRLFLSFPKTQSGTLDLIYFSTREPLGAFNYIDVPVANTDLTITDFETQVLLPEDYFVLWTFGAKGGSELPSLEYALVFVILSGGLGYMMRPKPAYAALYVAYNVGLWVFSPVLLVLSLIASIILVLKRHVEGQSLKWMLAGAAGLVVLCLAAIAVVGVLGIMSSGGVMSQRAVVSSNYAVMDEAAPPQAMQKSLAVMGSGEGAINVPVREGVLPVRLELPALGKSITVTSHLVHKDDPLRLSVLVVAGWLKYFLYLVSLGAGLGCVGQLRRN
jgi:hypothetical protein